jgi:hypothetical protein
MEVYIMEYLYEMIFKRKSMRRFNDELGVSKSELQMIMNQIQGLKPLCGGIHTEVEIVNRTDTSCKRGQYCLLVYSEVKEHYLLNVGYMFEQLDLYLASMNIGVCWYGFGKTQGKHKKPLEFVIMLAFGKCLEKDFRKDMYKSKRKDVNQIWQGEVAREIANIVRFAPSSCNMQPWRIRSEENKIQVFRTTNVNSIMPQAKRPYYNSIDMGIFLCFLEIVLHKNSYKFERELFDIYNEDEEEIKIAEYRI